MGNGLSVIGDVLCKVVIPSALSSLVGIFFKPPQGSNDTLQDIYRRQEDAHRQQERAVEEERFRNLEAATTIKEEAARAALAEAHKLYEEAAQLKAETAAAATRQVVEAALQREENALLRAEQTEEAARQRVEAALLKAKQTEEAARKRAETALLSAKQIEEASRQREALAREGEESAHSEASKANEALQRGIRPVVIPTQEEVTAAKKRIKYDTSKLHLAVCGVSGSGKSSVINAVRGLRDNDNGAAKVGVTECTSQITRYPDLRKELPYSRFVWYDIPGAGTTDVPDWQYFNDQGLFVFDFMIMVYDVRFTKIDVGIIENCLRFNIPVFIVRSKADQHILNMIRSETDCDPQDTEYDRVFQEMSTRYVEETRADFVKHMEHMVSNEELDDRDRQLLNSQRVYIISAATLRLFLSKPQSDQMSRVASKVIDEVNLVEEMLRAGARRRYPKTTVARSLINTGKEALAATFTAVPKLPIPSRAGALTLQSHAPVEDSLKGETLDPIASGNEEYVLVETDEVN